VLQSVLKLKRYVYIFNNHFFNRNSNSNHAFVSFACSFATKISVEDAYRFGQIIMGRADRRLGKLVTGSPEDLRFRGFFGVSTEVAVEAWEMMDEQKCLPSDPLFLHYLWALAFMRTYPANDEALSRVVGGSDPKTIHKYMWPYIDSIFELDEVLVSRLLCIIVE
jgi:hypothetical protein